FVNGADRSWSVDGVVTSWIRLSRLRVAMGIGSLLLSRTHQPRLLGKEGLIGSAPFVPTTRGCPSHVEVRITGTSADDRYRAFRYVASTPSMYARPGMYALAMHRFTYRTVKRCERVLAHDDPVSASWSILRWRDRRR